MATEIEAARLLVQRASWMGRNGIPLTGGQGSMSKLKSGQVAVWATRTLHGPRRPVRRTPRECPLEKWFRDAKIYELFEGTAEIQRLVISRMQVAEYRERLLEAAAIAAEATEPQLGGSVAATRRSSTTTVAAAPNGAGRRAVPGRRYPARVPLREPSHASRGAARTRPRSRGEPISDRARVAAAAASAQRQLSDRREPVS